MKNYRQFIVFATLVSLLLTACETTASAESDAHSGAPGDSSFAPSEPHLTSRDTLHSSELTNVPPAATPPDTIPANEFLPDNAAPLPSYAYLTGRFDPAEHPAFVPVSARYTDGDPYLLHAETYAAFKKMHAAAAADGITLTIVSATRNFARQKAIWEAKWNGRRPLEGKDKADEVYPDPADRARAILRYSSMPGTSRHHWGTDIDLNDLNNAYFTQGEGKAVYDWLTAHAATYGFCQPYSPKGPERPTGYEEERWHWSYLPLANRLTVYAAERLRDRDLRDFDGAAAAPAIGVVEGYVLGINPDCRTN